MHEQRGSFQGVDTCDVTNIGDFSFTSFFLDQSESLSIANKIDINALLTRLGEKQLLPLKSVESMRKRALEASPSPEVIAKYIHGATYISLDDSIDLQKQLTIDEMVDITINPSSREEINDNSDNEFGQQNNTNFRIRAKPNWVTKIVFAQKLDEEKYGAVMTVIPAYRSKGLDTRLLWIISAVLTQLKELWEETCAIPMCTSKWHGWLLTYLTKHCFDSIALPRTRSTPYKSKFISTIPKIAEKLGITRDYIYDSNDIRNIFSDHDLESVLVASIQDHFQNLIRPTHNLIILYKDNTNYNNFSFNINTLQYFDIEQQIAFELRSVVLMQPYSIRNINSFKGKIYSRHGRFQHTSWWKQERGSQFPIQVINDVISNINMNHVEVLVFVKHKRESKEKMRDEFLRYIGGQSHVYCERHNIPLITSYNKDYRCCSQGCNRKVSCCCPEITCKSRICKRCFDSLDENSRNYITYYENDNETHNEAEVNNTELQDDNCETNASLNEDIDDVSITSSDASIEFYRALDKHRISENDDQDEFKGDNTTPSFDDIDAENFLIYSNPSDFPTEDEEDVIDDFPTTHAGDFPLHVDEDLRNNRISVNGHVILNQACTLLSRQDKSIRGFSVQKHFLQCLVSVIESDSIPLIYPEAMSFPSIFYYMISSCGSIIGALPSSLLAYAGSRHGFASPKDHIRTRMTSYSSSSSSNQRYLSFLFDIATNLTLNRQDTRIILNRGLVAASNEIGLDVNHKDSSGLHDSIDSKQMVRNLCASQKNYTMHYFLTFTCNQKLHFGTSPIKNWIDGDEWKHCFMNFFNRPHWEQQEIHNQLIQAAGPLLLRNWLETRIFLIEYLRGSESSPYFPAECIFVRDEYQDHKGNLPHIHMMISVKLGDLNSEQKERLDDLIRASPGELVKPHEVQGYINEGIFQNIHEIEKKKQLCKKLNSHRCTPRCLMRVDHKNGKFDYRCRKTNNFRISPDNTRHCNVPLPVERSQEALDILIEIGLAEPRIINKCGHEEIVKCKHHYFHPVKHIPPTLSTFDPNMSPVEGKTFSVCQSQQNIQTLRGNNGCNKYVLKYATK